MARGWWERLDEEIPDDGGPGRIAVGWWALVMVGGLVAHVEMIRVAWRLLAG